MTKWFGESWGAPICDPKEQTATPVGAQCGRCDKTIGEQDQGIGLPEVDAIESSLKFDDKKKEPGVVLDVPFTPFHLDCFLKSILPCTGCPNCKPEKYS